MSYVIQSMKKKKNEWTSDSALLLIYSSNSRQLTEVFLQLRFWGNEIRFTVLILLGFCVREF